MDIEWWNKFCCWMGWHAWTKWKKKSWGVTLKQFRTCVCCNKEQVEELY